RQSNNNAGFTIMEMLIAVGILAIVATVSVGVYVGYLRSAESVDSLATISVLKQRVAVLTGANQGLITCDDSMVKPGDLDNPYLDMNISPVAIDAADPSKGYTTGAAITARVDQHGTEGVLVAKTLLEELQGQNAAVKDITVSDTVTSFVVLLSEPGKPICKPTTQVASSPAGTTGTSGTAGTTGTAAVAAQTTQQVVVTPRASQPTPKPVAATVTVCPAGQEWITILTNGVPSKACGAPCLPGERRNDAGLCFTDTPPQPPQWTMNLPDPGVPPVVAAPGQQPTCPAGKTLMSAFVQGQLTNTCVTQCPAGETVDGSGNCVARCAAPNVWDASLRACIDPAQPPACPAGQSRTNGACTCDNGGQVLPDGTCQEVDKPCEDTYGPTCDLDFGIAMCPEEFVREMCAKYCGLCTGSVMKPIPTTRGNAPEPVMPYFSPEIQRMLPITGETLVLDDQALVQMFGVTSPDGTPLTVTDMQIEVFSNNLVRNPWIATRRADGRWAVTAVGDTYANVQTAMGFRNACQVTVQMHVTFSNGSGSTQASPVVNGCRQ
ncbi:MAG: prepilin-type N-terminal cleavage/methylation domain-containing protein, partial [Pseudomonadales bacterium]|nr:prepilin-type N-terminal cleavage/methylation domain-containing protein [Pseudomonadales bacterium]